MPIGVGDKLKERGNTDMRERVQFFLHKKLREVAQNMPIEPRELLPNEYPKIKVGKGRCELETAELIDKKHKRAIMYGDTHGLIFPFLYRAVNAGIIQLPIHTIVNVDEHADIAPYTNSFVCHSASWQRYGVDNHLWQRQQSYNWQPERSTATPNMAYSPALYIKSVGVHDVDALSPEVLSIDMDFFNNIKPGTDKFNLYIEKLKGLVKRAKCVCVFSSSAWTDLERLPRETMQKVVQEIQDTFTRATE